MNLIRPTTISAAIFTLLASMLAVPPAISHSGRSQPAAIPTGIVVDTLGQVNTVTQFSVFGSSGQAILTDEAVGPQFTLTEPTTIIEIGAFVQHCLNIVQGVPQCPSPPPFVVQIRPDKMGVPDLSTIIASFVAPNKGGPLLISYESVHPNLLLNPGTYYALFAAQNGDPGGGLLGQASSPFKFLAAQTNVGFIDLSTANAQTNFVPVATRVLSSTAFNVCLRDNTSGNYLQWNTVTGLYEFIRCSDGFTVSGTGTVALANGLQTLTVSTSNLRLSAAFATGQLTGIATIYVEIATGVWQTFRINDTSPHAVCACSG